MFKTNKKMILAICASIGIASAVHAQSYLDYTAPLLEDYFTQSSETPASPDSQGFVLRWTLLDPILKAEIRSNTLFTDTWLTEEFSKEYFKDQFIMVPKDGQKVKLDKKNTLKWHCLDSKKWNVKLYRFATGMNLRPTEGLFLAVTVINVEQDTDVRLSVGSNSASQWWLNGENVMLLSGDRRMVIDDCVSPVVTLKAGKNILRGAVINGPGMSDFCVRFYDKDGQLFKNFTVTNQ